MFLLLLETKIKFKNIVFLERMGSFQRAVNDSNYLQIRSDRLFI